MVDFDDSPGPSSRILHDDTKNFASEFLLSKIIKAHCQDVKKTLGIYTGAMLTAGKDGFLKLWTERAGNFVETLAIKQSDGLSISSAEFYQTPNNDYLLFAGRRDGSIAIFNTSNNDPVRVIYGHRLNVSTLFVDQTLGVLLSGSFDHMALVWSIEEAMNTPDYTPLVLDRHSNSVWAVSTVPGDPIAFITGGADRIIRLFDELGALIKTFTGHEDVVRQIKVLSEDRFISVANDSSLRVWDIVSGSCLHIYTSHSGQIIYDLCLLTSRNSNQQIVSCGEQGYMEVWNLADDHLIFSQIVRVPSHCAWSVAPLINGDIALGTGDGIVYIFTANKERRASDDVQQVFDQQLAFVLSEEDERQRAEEEKKVVTIRVKLDSGENANDLNYIKGTDPTEAALKFIQENNISLDYLDEITQFIISNVPEAKNYITHSGSLSFTDGSASSLVDPFTGGSRYVPGIETKLNSPSVQNGSEINYKRKPRGRLVPIRSYFTFGLEGISPKVFEKLTEFNDQQNQNEKLGEIELEALKAILNSETFEPDEAHISALLKGLKWSPQTLVPVLDIFRISLLNEKLNYHFCSIEGPNSKGHSILQLLIDLISSDSDPLKILVARSITNASLHKYGQKLLSSKISLLSTLLLSQLKSSKSSLQISASTALANISRVLVSGSEHVILSELGPREDVLGAIINSLKCFADYNNFVPLCITRLLQTVATLMWGDQSISHFAQIQGLVEIVEKLKDSIHDDDTKALVLDIIGMANA